MASNMEEFDEQPTTKTPRGTCTGENCSEGHCTIFSDFPDDLIHGLFRTFIYFFAEGYSTLECFEQVNVTSLVVENCNGDKSYPFSGAFCSVERSGKRYLFASLFENGFDILINYTRRKEKGIPENKQERIILAKLLHFLMNLTEKGENDPLQKLGTLKDETEITILLANHLFGKLSTSADFIVDKQCKWKGEKCPCSVSTCKLTGDFGDTSIGNCQVWHGNLDIIIKNDIALQTSKDEESSSPGGKSPVEEKKGGKCLEKNSQIIAATIVFSFLKKQKQPESRHYMFPCIGISDKEMVIYFYDSEQDVLLESNRILLQTKKIDKTFVSVLAVVTAWLVVNYKFLSSGLTAILKNEKANFFLLAKSKFSVYQHQLRFGNVGSVQHTTESSISSFPLILDPVTDSLRKKNR